MYKMGSPEAISSVQLLKDMMDVGSMSSEVINWSQAEHASSLFRETAMMINGHGRSHFLKESVPDKKGIVRRYLWIRFWYPLGGEGFP